MGDLNITQAARLTGKSLATIRRWAAQKTIPARKTEDGHWVFSSDELVAHLHAHGHELIGTRPIAGKAEQPNNQQLIGAYAEQIKTLEGLLEREQRLNDELREQLKSTTGEVFKLTAELRAFLSKETKTTPTQWIKTKVQGAFSKSGTEL